MSTELGLLVTNLGSANDIVRKNAVDTLMALSEERVDWLYTYFDTLAEKFYSDNSYQRNIAAMLFANLAKSDDHGRLGEILDRFIAQMDDEKFITARITIQASWKIAVAGRKYTQQIVEALKRIFHNNRHSDTHPNLIRLDAVSSLYRIYAVYPDAVDLSALRTDIAEACESAETKKLFAVLDKGGKQ